MSDRAKAVPQSFSSDSRLESGLSAREKPANRTLAGAPELSNRSDRYLRKTAELSLILAAAACVALWLARIYYAISFATPYMFTTTGSEEESLFSIWKFTQHQAVYTDPYRIPFAVSYFNWAYYYSYGSIASLSLHLLHLDAIWIPTIGRLITIAFTLITGAIFCLTARAFVKAGLLARGPMAWAWCLIATVSPLVGFWSITVRPDIGALAFEAAGLYVILCYLRTQDLRLIVVAALLFYAAWAFKQSSVTMLTGSVLTLVLLKRWRAFLTLSAIWWFLVIVTLIVGGPVYRECLLFSQRHLPMSLSYELLISPKVPRRNPFFLLCLVAIAVWSWGKFRHIVSEPIEAALALVISFSFCFALLTSFKVGADDNYFIPAAWASMLAFALFLGRTRLQKINLRWVLAGLILCSWFVTADIAHDFRKPSIYFDLRSSDSTYSAIAEKLSQLPGPAFVGDPYADLPWVQRFSPHFVVAYAYIYDRAAGVPFEDDGWEGLAREGYFATLVLTQEFSLPPSDLQKYKFIDEVNDGETDYRFYRRIGTVPSNLNASLPLSP